MRACRKLGADAMAQLSEEELFHQPNEVSNSVAQVVRHMAGNMQSRWTNFLTEDGEKEWRNRDQEFEANRMGRDELIKIWDAGWNTFLGALDSLREEDLEKTVQIRSQSHDATDAIVRQLTHYASHVGQIVYLAKMIRGANWQTLSIAPGASQQYNDRLRKGS